MYIQCKVCSEIFVVKTRRGRPPTRCGDCEGKALPVAEVKLIDANERMDRLEIMLKSRGNHISQHRKDYE
jgi:uncharacterized Zn finger protein